MVSKFRSGIGAAEEAAAAQAAGFARSEFFRLDATGKDAPNAILRFITPPTS
jgi:hypothetical protein